MTKKRVRGHRLARACRGHRMFIAIWAGFAFVMVTATLALLSPGAESSSSPTTQDETIEQLLLVGQLPLRSLTVGSAEAAMAPTGEEQVSVELRVFSEEFTAANPQPRKSAIDTSLDSLVTVLGQAGFDGSIHIEATSFMLYRGTVPGFGPEVIVSVAPAIAGAHDNVAQQQASLNNETNAATLLPDVEHGDVWIGASVAYGRAAGPQPHEWVALQLEDEFYLVSVDHLDTNTVVGPESMINLATRATSEMRKLGFTTVEDRILDSRFAQESPQDAAIVWTMFSTRCPAGVPRTVCERPLLDSSN